MIDWLSIGKGIVLLFTIILGFSITLLLYSNPYEESLAINKMRQYRNFLRMSILVVSIAPGLPPLHNDLFIVDLEFCLFFPFYESLVLVFGTDPLWLILVNLLILMLYGVSKYLRKYTANPLYYYILFAYLIMPDIIIFAIRDVSQYSVPDSLFDTILILTTLSLWIFIALFGSLDFIHKDYSLKIHHIWEP